MIDFQLDLSPALSRLVGAPQAMILRAGRLAARRAAEEYVDAMHEWIRAGKSYTPAPGPSPTIEQGLGWRGQGDGAVVFSQAAHSPYVEFDTKPHLIGPKPGRKALRFFAGGGGGMLIRRSVRHPGTKAQPFFFADRDAREARLLGAAREAVAEVLGAGDA